MLSFDCKESRHRMSFVLVVCLLSVPVLIGCDCSSREVCSKNEDCHDVEGKKVCIDGTCQAKAQVEEKEKNQGEHDGGTDGDTVIEIQQEGDGGGFEVSPEKKPDNRGQLCPTGCQSCGSQAGVTLKKDAGNGEYCEVRCAKSNCKQGLVCVTYSIDSDTQVFERGFCYSSCSSDKDCENGQSCSPHPNRSNVKYCATQKKKKRNEDPPQTCDHGKGEICPKNFACLSNVDEKQDKSRVGSCVACTKLADCQKPGATFKAVKVGEVCSSLSDGNKQGSCAAGLICLINSYLSNAPYNRNKGYCYKPCSVDTDCEGVKKCVSPTATGATKVCGHLNGELFECNYSEQKFCDSGYDCVITDTDSTAGKCYKTCVEKDDCGDGKECKVWGDEINTVKDQPVSFCFDKITKGPKCYGQKCDASATATNCQDGLKCVDNVCIKTCTHKTKQKDCRAGETCVVKWLETVGLCQPNPVVTKIGEKCSPTKPCDRSKELVCLNFSDGRQESRCIKACDRAKGDMNNPDCPQGYACQNAPAGRFGICRKIVKYGDSCFNGNILSAQDQRRHLCLRMSLNNAYFVKLCHPRLNFCSKDGKQKDLNPECDGGKGTCELLSSVVPARDGNKYRGFCRPAREKTIEPGQSCISAGSDENTINHPQCKGDARCINAGSGDACMLNCDPCKSTYKNGDWSNAICGGGQGGACNTFHYSTGKYAFSVCSEQGVPQKVLNEGDACLNDPTKTCKDGLRCVPFSNHKDAKALCVRLCDFTSNTNQCAGERCAKLSDTVGICLLKRRNRRKLGETCKQDLGLPGFHDCLKTQDGKKLRCSLDKEGNAHICQVACDVGQGMKDNSDCVAAGLREHVCVTADFQTPTNGVCMQKCSFSNKARCEASSCDVGSCSTNPLGNNPCKTPSEKETCTKNGGVCVGNACTLTVCN